MLVRNVDMQRHVSLRQCTQNYFVCKYVWSVIKAFSTTVDGIKRYTTYLEVAHADNDTFFKIKLQFIPTFFLKEKNRWLWSQIVVSQEENDPVPDFIITHLQQLFLIYVRYNLRRFIFPYKSALIMSWLDTHFPEKYHCYEYQTILHLFILFNDYLTFKTLLLRECKCKKIRKHACECSDLFLRPKISFYESFYFYEIYNNLDLIPSNMKFIKCCTLLSQ